MGDKQKTRREMLLGALGAGLGMAASGCTSETVDNVTGDKANKQPFAGVELEAQMASSIHAGDAGLWTKVESVPDAQGKVPAWPWWTNRDGNMQNADGCGPTLGDVPLAAEQFVDARRFGARGDGCTDDRPALQAAIDSLAKTGGTVFIPAGTYLINQKNTASHPPLLLRGGVSLAGAGRGATILKLGDAANESFTQAEFTVLANFGHPYFNPNQPADGPFTITGLTVDGNLAGNPGRAGKATACIALDNCASPRIADVRIVNSVQYGILLGKTAGCDDGAFESLWVQACKSVGICIFRGHRHRFVNCHCLDNIQGGAAIIPQLPGDDNRDHSFVNCSFNGSNVGGAAGFYIAAIVGAALENTSLVNCEMRGNLVGMDVIGGQGALATDLRVVNCAFVGSLNTAFSINAINGHVIGCSFIDNESSGSNNGTLILEGTASGWVLTANRVKPFADGKSGIVLRKGTSGHIIVGNQYVAAGSQDYLVTTSQVDLAASVIHSNIGGRVYDNDGKPTTADVHTVVTKATGAFTVDELKNGRIGYRQDTNDLVFNFGGALRKINTQPA